MATPEQQVSPEEKLLKVIQGDGKSAAQPAAKPAAAVKPAAAPKPAEAPVADKSKLKIVKPEAAPARPVAEPAAEVVTPPAFNAAAVHGRKRQQAGLSMSRINLGLAAVIVLLLGFTVVDILGNVSAKSSFERNFATVAYDKTTKELRAGVDASDVARAFEIRPIFIDVAAPEQGNVTNVTVAAPVVIDLQKTVKVIGFSGSGGEREVILADTRDGRMYFAKSGQKFSIGDQQLELLEIQSDRAIVALGGEKVILTPGIVAPSQPGSTGERKK